MFIVLQNKINLIWALNSVNGVLDTYYVLGATTFVTPFKRSRDNTKFNTLNKRGSLKTSWFHVQVFHAWGVTFIATHQLYIFIWYIYNSLTILQSFGFGTHWNIICSYVLTYNLNVLILFLDSSSFFSWNISIISR